MTLERRRFVHTADASLSLTARFGEEKVSPSRGVDHDVVVDDRPLPGGNVLMKLATFLTVVGAGVLAVSACSSDSGGGSTGGTSGAGGSGATATGGTGATATGGTGATATGGTGATATGGTGATGGSGGGGTCDQTGLGAKCAEIGNPNNPTCTTCMQANCCAPIEACFADTECVGFNNCIGKNCATAPDINACAQASCGQCASQNAVTLFNAVGQCVQTSCAAECGGGGGTGGSAGAAGAAGAAGSPGDGG